MGLLGGAIAGFLTEHFGPETTGSGIPQIKAILGGVPIPLNLRVAVVKFFGGMIALGSGLSCAWARRTNRANWGCAGQ